MFLINKIKYLADKKYDIYEKRITVYYNCDNIHNFITNNLTDYIYRIQVQSFLTGVFYNTSISVQDVNKYIRNLYISYYIFYIKNVINDGYDYIITTDIINKFIINNNKLLNDTKWIYKHTETNIKLDIFITNIFKKIYSLRPFERDNKSTINDIFLYLAKLLDFIINENMDKIIISLGLGNLL